MSKNSEYVWTPEQKKAIETDGNILISASAGSGKTTVLVARILNNIIKKNIPINRMLVLTFTEMASSEMKEKIRKKLVEEVKKGDNAKLLKEQIALLPFSQISTIHSFCMELARSYFDYLAISPTLEILSEMDIALLKSKAFNNAIEKCESSGIDLNLLVNVLTDNRKFTELYEVVNIIYNNIEIQVDKDFVKNRIQHQFAEKGIKETEQLLVSKYVDKANALKDRIESIIGSADKNLDFLKAELERLAPYLKSDSLCELISYATNDDFKLKMVKSKSNESEEFVSAVDSIKTEISSLIKDIKQYYPYEETISNYKKTEPILTNLILFTEEFGKEYQALKKKENKVDFNDLETYALEILQNDDFVTEIQNRYDAVFVDEYQDTNPIQEYIVSKLANKSGFYVGDLKQSIYGFRLCEPRIIKNRYNRYKQTGEGEVIDLNCNYRSSLDIITFVNKIFDTIMTERTSLVDYKNTSRLEKRDTLNQTIKEKLEDKSKTKIVLFDKEKAEKPKFTGRYSVLRHKLDEVVDNQINEAKYILNEINNLVGVVDIDGRKCRYSDIAILCQSRNSVTGIVEYLGKYIPINAIDFEQKSSQNDIKIINDVLSVAINFKQDIPLTRALLSYFGGLSEQDLATIRIEYKDAEFFDAVLTYAKLDNPLGKKIKSFLDIIDEVRFTSSFKDVPTLFRNLLKGYDEYILSLDDGEARLNDINNYIIDLQDNNNLNNIIDYLEYTKNNDIVTKATASSKDAVTVMTIHKSKGLEYPIVFLPKLDAKFNRQDLIKPFLYNNYVGAGIYYYDGENYIKKNTIGRRVVSDYIENNQKMEYIRLFYVAMTRAKDRLYLLADNDGNNKLRSVEDANSYLDMLKVAINCDEELQSLVEYVDIEKDTPEDNTIYKFGQPDDEYVRLINDTINYRYKYKEATEMLFKHTATSINKSKEFDGNIYKITDDNQTAKTGTIYHKVMQYINFDCYTLDEVTFAIDKLVEEKYLTAEERAVVDDKTIYNVLQLDIINYTARYKHFREKEFLIKTTAKELGVSSTDDTIMVQGVIDLLILGDKNILVDYKFSSMEDEKLVEMYKKQFYVYELAVKTVFGASIDKKIIINLKKARQIEVD